MSVNSPQLEGNLLSTLKTRGSFCLKVGKISAGRNFTLNFFLMKSTPDLEKILKYNPNPTAVGIADTDVWSSFYSA